ncbi:MAG TPA: hypothetical protein VN633_14965 [Bryobacteraceae bacterium]|nr:hypothetical protein [Bryobacteraceae bacterium]
MDPVFLVPETTTHAGGEGAAAPLGDTPPASVMVTLGITHVIEQELLMVSVQGSVDGSNWTALTSFPQKFYTGVSSVWVDLSKHSDVRFLRAVWKAQRWGRGDKTPKFTFYVFAEPM